jgi:hypothetical protein
MKNLFGLKNDSKVKLYFDVKTSQVIDHEGIDEENPDIQISDEKAFSMPIYITVNHIPFYPSKYEFISEGTIVYASNIVPIERIRIINDNFLFERCKVKQNTITLKDLTTYNAKRKRLPSQNKVMGESARNHICSLIMKGDLVIKNEAPISWHWCHLIAFSLLSTEKAQKKNNLVCGTAACNGHMTNIETAVKKFIYEFKRPLALEVTATTYGLTHVAKRIRYRIYDKKGSQLSYSEYFDTLTDVKSDTADYETIYNRMVNFFNKKGS